MNHFTTIELNAHALNRALADFGIMNIEPMPDGLNMILADRKGKPRILEICSGNAPLSIRLSDPLQGKE